MLRQPDWRVHALVTELETARKTVEAGATVVQLRLKDVSSDERLRAARGFSQLDAIFMVNDDVDCAIACRAYGVHLGARDLGAARAVVAGLLLGMSAATVAEAQAAEHAGASYIGAGPVWQTPSKPDAAAPIGLDGLRELCAAVAIPVVAIGGIDSGNAADCIRAGAAGVAVIRAVSEMAAVRAAVDAALQEGEA